MQKENRKQKTKKLNIGIIIILCMLMSVCLAGCKKGNDKKVEDTSNKTQTTVATTEEVVETKEEVVAEEPVQLTLKSWGDSLNYEEPRLGVWNTVNSQGTIFEEGQQYEISKDDQFFMYVPIQSTGISFNSGPKINGTPETVGKCKIVNYEYEATNDISITVEGAAGKDYTMSVCLLSSDTNNSGTTGGNATTIEEWVEELSETVKEPGIAVFNESTGDKVILENGQEYQIKEGDKTLIYMPGDLNPYYMQPIGAKSYELGYQFILFELEDNDKVDVEYELASDEVESIRIYATFIK